MCGCVFIGMRVCVCVSESLCGSVCVSIGESILMCCVVKCFNVGMSV